jgi:hypothetical protein
VECLRFKAVELHFLRIGKEKAGGDFSVFLLLTDSAPVRFSVIIYIYLLFPGLASIFTLS